jgi:protein-L-isoaspartate(D-aspartate) O-methyltransferase
MLFCVLCVLLWPSVSCSGKKDDMEAERNTMVEVIKAHGVTDGRILAAMGKVRRHVFMPGSCRGRDAYGDHPCPIGFGQTISQPFIVAYMTQRMGVRPGMRTLEIGTGSGYQAAVLAELGARVYSVEIIPELAEHARRVLEAEGYGQVAVKTGDGYKGWPEHAPFDAIIVTCAPDAVPAELVKQLKEGGRMILPVGSGIQQLVILEKSEGALREMADLPVRFVPMVRGAEPNP